MSAELVIIIIGIVLLLIASITSIKPFLSLINIRVRLLLGIFGVLLIIYGGYSYGLVNPQSQIEQAEIGSIKQVQLPVDRVQIISPLEGNSVDCRILTMGVYPEKFDKDIWVLLKPTDNKYYPQSDHTNTSFKRNGKWQVITRFGGDKDEVFEIIVYEADSSASAFFSATIQKWKDALSYPGLEIDEIPSGAKEVDRISVKLRDNCRGVF
jgi:hypothetical protein